MSARALQIFVLQDGQLVSSEVFPEGSFDIGSSPDCDLTLAGDLIAPQHAVLHFREGRAVLSDAGRSGGTLVNGQEIAEAIVTSADDIHLGPYLLKLRQLSKRRSTASPPPSGYAGGPVAALRPRTNTGVPPAAAERARTPLTSSPGRVAPSPVLALAEGASIGAPSIAPVIPLRPTQAFGQEFDVETLLKSLERAPTPLTKPVARSQTTAPVLLNLAAPEPTLRDVSYLQSSERTTTPAAPLWIEVLESPEEVVDADVTSDFELVEATGAPVTSREAFSERAAGAFAPAKSADSRPKSMIPGMFPAPPIPPIQRESRSGSPLAPLAGGPRTSKPPKALAASSPKSMEVVSGIDREKLVVRVLWGRHLVLVRAFERGEAVIAGASETVALPLYGFSLSRPTTLAEFTADGWAVRPTLNARVTTRDSMGRWRAAAATVMHGVALELGVPTRLSMGDVHVEFTRQQVTVPPTPLRRRDRRFLAILTAVTLVIGVAVLI